MVRICSTSKGVIRPKASKVRERQSKTDHSGSARGSVVCEGAVLELVYALEDRMINPLVWIIVGGGIAWVASLAMRMDLQQHAAQYRHGRLLARSWYRDM